MKRKTVDVVGPSEGENVEHEIRGFRGVRPKRAGGRAVEYKCVWERWPSDDFTWEPPVNFVTPAAQAMRMGYATNEVHAGRWDPRWYLPIFNPAAANQF